MSSWLLIFGSFTALGVSYFKDQKKTKKSLKMAKGMLMSTGQSIIGILFLIGLLLAYVPESMIQSLLGKSNQVISGLYGALIGTITIIPAFIAFPLAASLMNSGANLVSIAAFITTLTMVGFATLPVEIQYFGKKFAYLRNLLSFALALGIALAMVVVL